MKLEMLLIFVIQIPGLYGDYMVTSTAHIGDAVTIERDLAKLLKDYVKQEEERLERINKMADEFENHAKNALADNSLNHENPVTAFQLIRKFTSGWEKNVSPVINNNTWDDMFQRFKKDRFEFPTFVDLRGAARGLNRLQSTYDLDMSQVANGNLSGFKSHVLTEDECFELCVIADQDSDALYTLLWMEQALNKRKNNTEKPGECTDKRCADIMSYMASSYKDMDDIPSALEMTNVILNIDPNNEKALRDKTFFKGLLESQNRKKKLSKREILERNDDNRVSNFSSSCRGEKLESLKDQEKFYTCRYVTNNDPLLILQPAKEETMQLNPLVVVYHDVVREREIDTIKRLGKPSLMVAEFLVDDNNGYMADDETRCSKSGWLYDTFTETTEIMYRIQAITGLSQYGYDRLQVANYGLGGHYNLHGDYTDQPDDNGLFFKGRGNRVATFMLYLTDVEAGGATVFPEKRLLVHPKKGSAVFWYNLFKNGTGNFDTYHGACPVLIGDKWVGNVWIHSNGQEFKRPCGLNQWE